MQQGTKIVLGVVGIAAAAYGAYKTYKWVKERKEMLEWVREQEIEYAKKGYRITEDGHIIKMSEEEKAEFFGEELPANEDAPKEASEETHEDGSVEKDDADMYADLVQEEYWANKETTIYEKGIKVTEEPYYYIDENEDPLDEELSVDEVFSIVDEYLDEADPLISQEIKDRADHVMSDIADKVAPGGQLYEEYELEKDCRFIGDVIDQVAEIAYRAVLLEGNLRFNVIDGMLTFARCVDQDTFIIETTTELLDIYRQASEDPRLSDDAYVTLDK